MARSAIRVMFVCACLVMGTYYTLYAMGRHTDALSTALRTSRQWDSQSTTSPSRQTRQLLLVTYGRSGSTFTSAIINRASSVFYTSEPLHAMNQAIYDVNITIETTRKAFDILDAFLSCDFMNFEPELFKDELALSSSSTADVYRCLRDSKVGGYAHVKCFLSMWASCLERPLSFVKVIRFRGEWAERFMEKYPNLKILFLVRDVRAVLYSQANTFKTFDLERNGTHKITTFCQQLRQDVAILQKLKSFFPERIKGIRYEDGCLDPVKYSKEIYEFAGLDFDENVMKFVQKITKQKSRKGTKDAYSVEGRQSVKVMNEWRQMASIETVKRIDNICSDMYRTLGYTSVDSEKVLLSTNLLIAKPQTGGLFSE